MPDDEVAAWVVRTGRRGERDTWAIEGKRVGGGWHEMPDLNPVGTRAEMNELVERIFGSDSSPLVANYTGQLWALRYRIKTGDLMVLPMKTTGQIAIGVVTSGYRYEPDSEPGQQHVIDVEWKRTDIPRTALRQDLLFTLGSALTVFQPTKNDAVRRIEQLMRVGTDPGNRSSDAATVAGQRNGSAEAGDPVDTPELSANIAEVARDRITDRVHERFSGHALANLVAEILRVDGYHCAVSPPGPDGGVDIYAGRGPLGLDSPVVLVQVKSNADPIGSPVVTQLHGVMGTHGADQGLLVVWGGLNRSATDHLRNHKLRVRAWTSSEVVDALLRTYDRLPESIQSEVPLQRVWMLVEESDR